MLEGWQQCHVHSVGHIGREPSRRRPGRLPHEHREPALSVGRDRASPQSDHPQPSQGRKGQPQPRCVQRHPGAQVHTA